MDGSDDLGLLLRVIAQEKNHSLAVERNAARRGALQFHQPAGNGVRSIELELILAVTSDSLDYVPVLMDVDDVVSLARDECV